jgi:hypothetical protein
MGRKLKAAEVAELIGVSELTFRSYVSRKFAPESVGRDPKTGVLLWDRDEIQRWNKNRPGRGRWKASRTESQSGPATPANRTAAERASTAARRTTKDAKPRS